MIMATIDPIQFGQMMESLKHMSEDIKGLRTEISDLKDEVQSLINIKNSGKGILLGLTFASGGAGALLTKLMEHVK